MSAKRHQLMSAAAGLLASSRFAQALTLAAIGMAYLSFALRATMGWPGLIGVLAALVLLAALSITVKRHEIEWRGLLPISLLVFLGWSAFSLLWTEYQWAALGAVAYQWSFAFLGVYIALTRDLIQIVRAFGDVLRTVLIASLVLEILSGLLLDVPILFLRISGNLAYGGPIQGLFGTRNQLGLVALIALITFLVELRTRSIDRGVAGASIVLAGLALAFTRSPVMFGVLLVVAVAAAALALLRRTDPAHRRAWQFGFLGLAAGIAAILIAARGQVIALLNAGSEFEFRYLLWRDIFTVVTPNTLEGFGWIGYWRRELPPFIGISPTSPHNSALNAFIDVWLQLGLVGLCSFIALVGLAFVRSWLLASNKRSVVYVWPALMLVALLVTSAAESSVLVEFGWLTLVICALVAAQNLSWRTRLPEG